MGHQAEAILREIVFVLVKDIREERPVSALRLSRCGMAVAVIGFLGIVNSSNAFPLQIPSHVCCHLVTRQICGEILYRR